MKTVTVTAGYYRLMLDEVKRLEFELDQIQEEIRQLTFDGNLGDEYDAQPELIIEEQKQAALQLAKLRLKDCAVAPDPMDNLQVQIGSRVELLFGEVSRVVRLEGISGGYESSKGVCSLQSQLGRKIIGAKVGDKFMVKDTEVQIKSII